MACGLLSACNNDDLPPSAGFATLTGTVVDDTTHQPIAGATVTVDTVLTATTDASGAFKISEVPSGIADYTVQAPGYALIEATTNVEPGKVGQVAVTLDPHPSN